MLRLFGPPARVNDTSVYDEEADAWWDFSKSRVFLPLFMMTSARAAYLDRQRVSFDGRLVVDVGTGGGYMAEELARRGARVVGIDLARGALFAGRAHKGALPIAHAQASAQALPLSSSSCDRAVCTDVLVHLEDPLAALKEISRVLIPRGVLYFSTVSSTLLARFVLVTLGEDVLRVVRRGTHDPDRFHRPEELHALLAAAGFRLMHVEGVGPRSFRPGVGFTFGRIPTKALMYQGWAVKI